MISGHIARNAEQPGTESRQIATVTTPRPPGLLKGDGSQIFCVSLDAHAIAKKVIDARQLLRKERVPIRVRRGVEPPNRPGLCSVFHPTSIDLYVLSAKVSQSPPRTRRTPR